eukprot:6471233-Amphidinium_carterae.6
MRSETVRSPEPSAKGHKERPAEQTASNILADVSLVKEQQKYHKFAHHSVHNTTRSTTTQQYRN